LVADSDIVTQCGTGIGGVTALKLIQKHKRLEGVLASMEGGRYEIPDPFPFEEARRLFKGTVLPIFSVTFYLMVAAGDAESF
jgi:5'-3' exonuclease